MKGEKASLEVVGEVGMATSLLLALYCRYVVVALRS